MDTHMHFNMIWGAVMLHMSESKDSHESPEEGWKLDNSHG
jgi:hypothetical protein